MENIIEKGSLFLLTSGEYDSYELHTLLKAEKDIQILMFSSDHRDINKLLNKLIREGFATRIEFFEWWLGYKPDETYLTRYETNVI